MIQYRIIFAVFLFLICFQTVKADWIKQNTKTLAWLHDVYFFNENEGFVAGSNGAFLETADGKKDQLLPEEAAMVAAALRRNP